MVTKLEKPRMSVEKLQLLHEDYIRLTERFKALWTFHQFLRGIAKTNENGALVNTVAAMPTALAKAKLAKRVAIQL